MDFYFSPGSKILSKLLNVTKRGQSLILTKAIRELARQRQFKAEKPRLGDNNDEKRLKLELKLTVGHFSDTLVQDFAHYVRFWDYYGEIDS